MPNITREELDRLNGLFGDIRSAAIEIKRRAPNVKAQCEQIEKHSQVAYEVLREIQERGLD